MKFFFPDSQDFVDPSFDFETETRSELRVRQRDDLYPHEVFSKTPYDGLLVSKAIVDGMGGVGRYTMAQRHRLYRVGIRKFMRIPPEIKTMGDCGAFSYVNEETPAFTVTEILDFYSECGFDYGISLDHVILGFREKFDTALPGVDPVPTAWRERQQLTLDLARDFLAEHGSREDTFNPMGVAQGWSPRSYAHSVQELQRMGYGIIALGGLVPLKTQEILSSLEMVNQIREPETQLHLLGVTRCGFMNEFSRMGVTSFDSTSPLRQAFKDDRDNYYTPDGNLPAIRVPQVAGNNKLKKRILSGEIEQSEAIRRERECLRALIDFDVGERSLRETVAKLIAYSDLVGAKKAFSSRYEEILEARPWKQCECEICQALGIHIIIFRGAERNRRRGFHNLYVFRQELNRHLNEDPTDVSRLKKQQIAAVG